MIEQIKEKLKGYVSGVNDWFPLTVSEAQALLDELEQMQAIKGLRDDDAKAFNARLSEKDKEIEDLKAENKQLCEGIGELLVGICKSFNIDPQRILDKLKLAL
jgi:hypothetical protein